MTTTLATQITPSRFTESGTSIAPKRKTYSTAKTNIIPFPRARTFIISSAEHIHISRTEQMSKTPSPPHPFYPPDEPYEPPDDKPKIGELFPLSSTPESKI